MVVLTNKNFKVKSVKTFGLYLETSYICSGGKRGLLK